MACNMTNHAQSNSVVQKVVREDARILRKHGDAFCLEREIEAMEFVRSRTTIPIPRIVSKQIPNNKQVELCNIGSFRMEYLPGCRIGTVWQSMTTKAQRRTTEELRDYLKQLRSLLHPHPGVVGSCSGGPAYDHRIDNLSTCGPFKNVQVFHDHLLAPLRRFDTELAARYQQKLSDGLHHRALFTHADLSVDNILVDGDTGQVTGILDWEMAGFWPEWWEYRKGMYGYNPAWWFDLLVQVIESYPLESEIDEELELH